MKQTIRCEKKDGKNIISLLGRIDTGNAEAVGSELTAFIAEDCSAELVFDLSELEYISSAGLRVFMKTRKLIGKPPEMVNVPPEIYEILETTGFTELFTVRKKLREMSVEGCRVIGKGYYGTVYRTDEETVVKVYNSPDCLSMIQNEKQLARTALVAGVPTALSYDIVRVGDTYGSVFELLDAKNCNDLLIEQPENADAIIKQYAEFMHLVNSQTVPEGKLRSAKQQFLGYLDDVRKYMSGSLFERLKALISAVPEQHNVIHGDSQMKNIMIVEGEPMLIDMDTLCEGYPIFEIQSVYVTYFAFTEDEPNNSMDFLGISNELAARVWELFVGYYFGTDDKERIARLRDKIALVGSIRFLYLIDIIGEQETELFKIRVKHTTERLEKLANKVDSLLFDDIR